MPNLTGKYAVVTGAGKGIGRKIVERFLAEGAAGVVILDYDPETANRTVDELNAGQRLIAVKCDVSSAELVQAAFQTVYERFPRVDILINNAGLTRDAMLHKMSVEQWDTVLETNLKGQFLCMKQVIPAMREARYGKIVNVSSTSAYGNIGQTNYAASKAGVLGMSAAAALELGRYNITVNVLLPGYVDTDIIKTVPQDIIDGWVNKAIPMRRLGKPEELASAALFLACDDSSFVTGAVLPVCGGGLTTY